MNPNTKLAAARLMACQRSPYFTTAITGLVPAEAPGLGTLGVTADMVMLYDPDVVARWSVNHLATVLEHETHHILRDHHGRAAALGLSDGEVRGLWNIAADAEINDDLRDGGREFPVGVEPIFPETLAKHGVDPSKCERGLLAESYYALLRDAAQQQQQQGDDQQGQQGDVTAGRCGSCAGNPLPGEDEHATDEDGNALGRSDVDLARVRQEVAAAVEREVAAKGQGSVPGGLRRWAEKRRKSQIRWQDKLRRAARRATQYAKGAGDYTSTRPHRRYSAMRRRNPSTPIMPAMHRPVPRVTVAIDTSMSMGSDEVEAALAEVEAVLKHNGSDVGVVSCDAEVQAIGRVRSVRDAAKLIVGGGGTDFRPVFAALERAKDRPDVLVFVTDGCGPAPDTKPAWAHVIWVLVGRWQRKPCEWGEHIEVKEAA